MPILSAGHCGGIKMKNHLSHFVIAAVLICIPMTTITAEQGPDRSDSVNDCNSRCAVLDGESRYRCLKTCINTRKKNAPTGENEIKRKISECESICEPYKGIENIRCRRICLDNRRYIPAQKKEPAAKDNPSPCESRCSILSGPNRENCIMQCEKKSRFESGGISEKKK